jgi:hypothetical protein
MIYSKNLEKDKKISLNKSKSLGIGVILSLLIMLTLSSCNCSTKGNGSRIYQTPILRIKAGTEVNTEEGIYKAQVDEIWHSDGRYRDLEKKLLYNDK